MKSAWNVQSLHADLAALLLRLLFGSMFMYYGWIKIQGYGLYIPHFKDYIGIGARLSYNFVIAAEFLGGFLILIGLFTRIAIIPIAFSLAIVVFVALAAENFQTKNLAIVYLVLCPVVFLLGSGRFSADAWMSRNRRRLTKK